MATAAGSVVERFDVVEAPDGIEKWTLAKRPSDSGSRNARAIIAYFAALWRTIAGIRGLPSPLVIDIPNQGVHDKKRLQSLLTAIALNVPAGAQVTLAHEENPEVFRANRVYDLTDRNRLMSASEFERLSPHMFFYVEQARAALSRIGASAGSEDPEACEYETE